MGSLSEILQRPLIAAAVVAIASVSSDFSDKFSLPKSTRTSSSSKLSNPSLDNSVQELNSTWTSHFSVSKLSNIPFLNKIQVPAPKFQHPVYNAASNEGSSLFYSSVASSPTLLNLYRSAELAAAKPTKYTHNVPNSPSEVSYRWHLPEQNAYDVTGASDCSSAKSRTVVVLLGWLGAKQKHLKRYADWYTSRGFHVITFTFPMSEILKFQVGGKVEQHIDSLVDHLVGWLEEEDEKNLVFHTFSNTGWLTYGAILENFQKQDSTLMNKIRGCIVDSAPVAAPDSQVWASGFSAAFLKKQSVATKGLADSSEMAMEKNLVVETKPAVTEAALLLILEKFFDVVLNLPTVNRRLTDVLGLLSSKQPTCPQLYIYSSADRVIPAGSVESFIELQRRTGREVRACNFVSTPHVDHYRNDPQLYTSQLTQFLEDCVLKCCKQSSS